MSRHRDYDNDSYTVKMRERLQLPPLEVPRVRRCLRCGCDFESPSRVVRMCSACKSAAVVDRE